MNKGFLIIGIIFINLSCFGQFATTEMKKIFSEDQISDLELINEFFQESICGNSKNVNFKQCLKNEISSIVDFGYDSISNRLDFDKQKILYKKLSDSTFNEIWGFAKMWKKGDRSKTYKYLGISTVGKYKDFLNELGKDNKYIKAYHDSFYASGALPWISDFLYQVLKHPQELNLNDPNIQIIIAIHIMTDLDYGTRNELWESK